MRSSSRDRTNGTDWVAYPFRYKPQDVRERPGIYAPYQPRFDWNLWFASLGSWMQNPMVPRTEELLLENDRGCAAAVCGAIRFRRRRRVCARGALAVLVQHAGGEAQAGNLVDAAVLGTYAPTLVRLPEGGFGVVEGTDLPPSEELQRP